MMLAKIPNENVWLQLDAVTHLAIDPHEEQVTRPLQRLLAFCRVSRIGDSLCGGLPRSTKENPNNAKYLAGEL